MEVGAILGFHGVEAIRDAINSWHIGVFELWPYLLWHCGQRSCSSRKPNWRPMCMTQRSITGAVSRLSSLYDENDDATHHPLAEACRAAPRLAANGGPVSLCGNCRS